MHALRPFVNCKLSNFSKQSTKRIEHQFVSKTNELISRYELIPTQLHLPLYRLLFIFINKFIYLYSNYFLPLYIIPSYPHRLPRNNVEQFLECSRNYFRKKKIMKRKKLD